MSQDQTGVAVAGRQRAMLGEIYRRHWLELCRYVASTFGAGPPDPEDVAQQAFVQLASLDDPEAVRNPRAFLYRTAHNIVITDKRRARTRTRYAPDLEYSYALRQGDDPTPERVILGKEQIGVVKAVLARMPRKRRRLLVLHRIHGLSYAEIARRTGYSQTAVKKHVAKAMTELDAALEAVERGQR